MTTSAGVTHLRAELARALRACTPKQRVFLRELPKHNFQPYSLAAKLGWSLKTVWMYQRNPNVVRARELIDEIAVDDLDVTTRRVLTGYAAIEKADIRNAFKEDGSAKQPHELDAETAYALSEVSYDSKGRPRFKFFDKTRALERMGNYRKLDVQRHEVTGKDGAPLLPNQPSEIEIARRVAFILARGLHEQPLTTTGESPGAGA